MSRTLITKTKNGFDVYVDTETSHAATHLENHPELFGYMKEILAEYEAPKHPIRFETNLGKVVGMMDLVETHDTDDVFYAKRPNRQSYTRFVRGKKAEPTMFVTIELEKNGTAGPTDSTDSAIPVEFDVFTVFLGRLTPGFPFGKDDPDQEKREFWKNHALVAGNQTYLPETMTTGCPW